MLTYYPAKIDPAITQYNSTVVRSILDHSDRFIQYGHFEIEITDNGTGIAPDTQGKIFEPFFTTKPTGTGTGLGLSVCYSVITHGHDGGVRVDSTEGEGATFIVTLPLASAT